MNEHLRKKQISPFLIVVISFLLVIFLGSLILASPIARVEGVWGSYLDALFVAFSSTCVTGLNPFGTGIASQYNFIGQLTILISIQIGGLGFMTFLAFLLTLFKNKLQFKDRLMLSKAVGSSSMSDLAVFVRKIVVITFSFELIGGLLLLPVFLQVRDLETSIWYAIFHSISAYCNAGVDLFGSTSLILGYGNLISELPAWAYNYLCAVIMVLVLLGGISFLVIIDIFRIPKFKQWRAFTKIVLVTSAILTLGGAVFFIFSDGLKSVNRMSVFQAFFQSVNLRTAGFTTYDQSNLSPAGLTVSSFLMFVGGSPLSTAGGIKTTTLFMIVIAMLSYFRSKKIVAFKRYYPNNMVIKAMSLTFLGIAIIGFSYLLLSVFERHNTNITNQIDLIYLTFSTFSTSGLANDITTSLSSGSKIILMVLMFVGRIGPITFMQVFQIGINEAKENPHIHYVEEDFLIG